MEVSIMKLNKMIFIVVLLITFNGAISFDDVSYVDGESVIIINQELRDDKVYVLLTSNSDELTYYFMNSSPYIIPTQFGDGVYSIRLFEKDINGKYRKLIDEKVEVRIENNVFLNKTSMISWDDDSEVFVFFQNMDINMVHEYIIEKFTYDKRTYDPNDTNYIPDIDIIFTNEGGQCLDFSVLFAAVSRERGIPCKLVYGKTIFNGDLHAWNEIYIDGEWKIVDITLDIAYRSKGWGYDMYKDGTFYGGTNVY
jgi:hypothetical protein